MNLDQTNAQLTAALGVVALLGAVLAWWRWVRPRWLKGASTWVKIRDSLIGREEIRDSITGRLIENAVPGIGVRMEKVETAIEKVATLIESEQRQNRRIEAVEDELAETKRRVQLLEEQTIERIAGKAESVAAWKAVEKIAETGGLPDLDGDPSDDIAELD